VTAALQEGKPAKVDAAGSSDAASEPTSVSEPAEKLPSPAKLGDDHDMDTTVSDVSLESGKQLFHPRQDNDQHFCLVNPTCQCQEGLSPRMKFILSGRLLLRSI
jgi:hypothetical protein